MSIVTAVTGTVVGLAVIGAVTALGSVGVLDGQTIASLFGVLLGGGGVGALHIASRK